MVQQEEANGLAKLLSSFATMTPCIDFLKYSLMRYYVYVVLIQEVNNLIEQNNVTICH